MTRFLQFLRDVTTGIDAVNMGRVLAFRHFMRGIEQANPWEGNENAPNSVGSALERSHACY